MLCSAPDPKGSLRKISPVMLAGEPFPQFSPMMFTFDENLLAHAER